MKRRRTFISASWPPLGILYLATILKERGIEVSVLDQPAKGFTVEETVKWVQKEDPDFLGFTTYSSSSLTATRVSSEVKALNPSISIIFGGYYASFNANRILKNYPFIDVIVRGEGENTLVDLVNCLNKGGKLKKVLGIDFKEGDNIIHTPDRPLIDDLDSIPIPDRSLLDEKYHSIIAGAKTATKKFTSIISSRGCVYQCRFCSCRKFAHNIWRPRLVENIVKELQYLTSEGFKQFVFVDDSFTLNQKRVIKLCQQIRKEKMDIEWFCESRVDHSSYEMLKESSKAGCKVIYFGIESANQRILDYYNKRITPQQSEKAVETARKAGIDLIVGSFILGSPDESKEEIQNTLEFAKQLSIDFPRFNVLGADPGTDIWNELKTNGILNEEAYWETGVIVPKICSSAVPFQVIEQMIHDAYFDFLSRPVFIMRQIVRLLKSPYRIRLLLNNLNRINHIIEESPEWKRVD